MIHRVTTRVFIAMAIVIAALNAPAEELARRKVFPKPTREIIKAAQYSPHAMLKLVEGSGVRLRGGRLIVDPQSITERLGRNGIDPDQLQPRVAALNTILAKYKATAARQFTREEKELDDYRAAGETATAQELGDQNLFYILTFKAADDEMIEALVELNALDVVEQASPMPKVTNPVVDKPPTTPLLTGGQGYFNAAPQGIGALNMGGIAGGLGQGVTITDVEYNWTPTHEDLKPPLSHHHPNTLPGEHGTAVLGVLVGLDNAYGIRGIARGANLRLVSHWRQATVANDVAGSVDIASSLMNAGDIILMETQSFCFDLGLCPSEFELAVFTAVQNATANDRIVVAAAGNGGSNLDDPDFEGRFNRSVRDSGAIIVAGATSTHPHVPTDTTNYGSRIDAHAWGENVTTTGGNGDLFRAGSDPEQEYTESFNGTSAASPIVTGAAAVIQGVRLARGLPPLTSVQMRAALQAGATPQGAGGNIGSMPNLEAAIAAIPTSAPEITATGNASSVFISWPALSGVSHYELYKRINAGSVWQLIYTGSAPQFTDTAVVSGRTYGYKARAIVGAGAPSAFSNFELATTITFTDPVITSFVTLVKAKHIVELRTAVNAMCTFATTTLCSTPRYSGSDLDENFVKTQTITAAHFTSIRTNTVSLRHAIGASPTSFRETTPIGALIKRIHMEDLRTGAN